VIDQVTNRAVAKVCHNVLSTDVTPLGRTFESMPERTCVRDDRSKNDLELGVQLIHTDRRAAHFLKKG
jgi:hypothetical protein